MVDRFRAGLTFSVSRAERRLRSRQNLRLSEYAPVFLAAVLQYVATELLDVTRIKASSRREKTLKLETLVSAVREDPELNELFGKVLQDLQITANEIATTLEGDNSEDDLNAPVGGSSFAFGRKCTSLEVSVKVRVNFE